MRRQPLGKGLNAILGNGATAGASGAATAVELRLEPQQAAFEVGVEEIVAGREQPRRRFGEEGLEELSASIRAQGVIQPLIVSRRDGHYELIAGERRLRAAARAGLDKVPVVLREAASEQELLEMALVENIQREDLDALERARAYQRLIESYGHTQEQVAQRVGKSRAAVSNTIRLLALPEPVQAALEQGFLSEGHARALLALPTAAAQIAAARKIAQKGLSVREAEDLVKEVAGTSRQQSMAPSTRTGKQSPR